MTFEDIITTNSLLMKHQNILFCAINTEKVFWWYLPVTQMLNFKKVFPFTIVYQAHSSKEAAQAFNLSWSCNFHFALEHTNILIQNITSFAT